MSLLLDETSVAEGEVYIRNKTSKVIKLVLASGAAIEVEPGRSLLLDEDIFDVDSEDDGPLIGPDMSKELTTYTEVFDEIVDLFPQAWRNLA